MKKLLFLALLALCVVGATAQKASDAYKASKNVVQNIATSSSPTLIANCRYTQLDINNWDKNAIEVKANIKVTCSNPKKVQAILDCIEVVVSKQGASGVVVVTNLDSKSIEAIKGRNENCNYTITIEINAPVGTTMSVDNKYGNTYIQGANSLNANVKYGNLTVGTIDKPSSVTIKYGNLKIDHASDLELAIKYGNATVEEMNNLQIIESGYGKHKYGSVNSVTGSVKYDKYSFGTINGTLNFGECKYTNVTVDILQGGINVGDLAYGGLTVDRTMHSFNGINVSARYSSVAVNVEKGIASNIYLFTSYGKLYPDIFGNTKYKHDNTNQSFTITGAASDKWIKITNRYGNIRVTDK